MRFDIRVNIRKAIPKVPNRIVMTFMAIGSLLILGIVGYNDYSGYHQFCFVINMASPEPGISQVFYNVGNGYNEHDSCKKQLQGDELQRYFFSLTGKAIKSLRFDPIDAALISATIRIKNAQIKNKHGDLIKTISLQDFRAIQQINKMDIRDNVLAVHTTENANDPILEIENSSVERHVSRIDYVKKRGWVIIGYGLLSFFFMIGLNYVVIFARSNQSIINGVWKLKIHLAENPTMSIALIWIFAVVLFGIKLWIINTYGNATPFWDQWDGEAVKLYKPYFDGTLTFSDWFAPHNEHRIFTTRLLSLGLLLINGIWNPLLQMVINAALHITALVLCIVLLTSVIGRKNLLPLLLFALVLFGVPYAWQNTLMGFQSQFYFIVLFHLVNIRYYIYTL